MKLALDITALVYFATVVFGTSLLGYLLWKFLFRPRGLPPLPRTREVPGQAVPEMRRVLQKVAREFFQATGHRRDRMEHEKKRLERRLEKLEQRTFQEQEDYFHAAKRRDSAWLRWKDLHSFAYAAGKEAPADSKTELRSAERAFQEAQQRVEVEWHTAIARDLINLEELQGQGVFTPDEGLSHPEPETPEKATPTLPELREETPETPPAEAPPPPEEEPAPPAGQPPREELHQADFGGDPPTGPGRRYVEPTFSLLALPRGGETVGHLPEKPVLQGADLPGCSFDGVQFLGVHRHQYCNFAGGLFTRISLDQGENPHHFDHCNFEGGDFSESRIAYTLFSNCNLSHTRWTGASLARVKFDRCNLEGLQWGEADLSQSAFVLLDGSTSDFSGASIPPHSVQGGSAVGPLGYSPPPPSRRPPAPPKVSPTAPAASSPAGEATSPPSPPSTTEEG